MPSMIATSFSAMVACVRTRAARWFSANRSRARFSLTESIAEVGSGGMADKAAAMVEARAGSASLFPAMMSSTYDVSVAMSAARRC